MNHRQQYHWDCKPGAVAVGNAIGKKVTLNCSLKDLTIYTKSLIFLLKKLLLQSSILYQLLKVAEPGKDTALPCPYRRSHTIVLGCGHQLMTND